MSPDDFENEIVKTFVGRFAALRGMILSLCEEGDINQAIIADIIHLIDHLEDDYMAKKPPKKPAKPRPC